MNLRDLQYLVAVADLKNFSQAAIQCCVSQPTLSNQIRKLEDTLGVRLFERTNRRVMTTEIGEQILLSARRILRERDTITALAAASQNPLAGNFRLGAFPTLSAYLFPDLVPRVQEKLPQLRLILVEEKTAELIDRLRSGALDAAFLALPVSDPQLEIRALFEDEFLLAVPPDHELTGRDAICQAELASYPLLLLEEGHCLRDQALDVCRLVGGNEDQDVRATGMETLRQMVKAGTGITLIPRIAAREDETGICYLPFEAPAPRREIALVWRKTTARRAVIDLLAELF